MGVGDDTSRICENTTRFLVKISLNLDKTHYMIFGNGKETIDIPFRFDGVEF